LPDKSDIHEADRLNNALARRYILLNERKNLDSNIPPLKAAIGAVNSSASTFFMPKGGRPLVMVKVIPTSFSFGLQHERDR